MNELRFDGVVIDVVVGVADVVVDGALGFERPGGRGGRELLLAVVASLVAAPPLLPSELRSEASKPHNGGGGMPLNKSLRSSPSFCSLRLSLSSNSSTCRLLSFAFFGGRGGGNRAGLAPLLITSPSRAPATANPTSCLSFPLFFSTDKDELVLTLWILVRVVLVMVLLLVEKLVTLIRSKRAVLPELSSPMIKIESLGGAK